MANRTWRGGATAIKQVSTITVGGTWATNDTVTLTVGAKQIVITITDASPTTAEIATSIKAAWENETDANSTRTEVGTNLPEFSEITATVSGSVVTLTGDTKGKPFTEATTKSSSLGTVTDATSTAATGPNHWDAARNWEENSVPVGADDVYIDKGDEDIKYGLDQSAVTVTSLTITQGYTGKIGLPKRNKDDTAETGDYPEYRDDYLKISATTCNLGQGVGNGSGRIKINFGTAQTTVNIYDSGTREENDVPAILLRGTHASNACSAVKGDYAWAHFPTETSTIATVRQGHEENLDGDVTGRLGPGCTLTTVEKQGGSLEINSAVTTLNQWAGETIFNGSGALTNLNARGGTTFYNSTGALGGAPVLSGTAILDFTRDPRAKTVTNPVKLYGAVCRLLDSFKVISTLVVDFNEGASEAQVDFGVNVRLTRGTPA